MTHTALDLLLTVVIGVGLALLLSRWIEWDATHPASIDDCAKPVARLVCAPNHSRNPLACPQS
jgi:hypothetical protein